MGKVIVVGIGPGGYEDMTIRADEALQACDAIVGYPVYVDLVRDRYPGKELHSTPMTRETERCQLVLELARSGKTAAMVCSGDSGIYGMAALVYELRGEAQEPEIKRACDILLRRLPEDRLCGIVRNIGRDGQSRRILTLAELREAEVDMFCTVFIGNSAAKTVAGQLITPRGYRNV